MDTTIYSRHALRTVDPSTESTTASPGRPAARWISVVFLQGEAAEKALGLLSRDGTDAAIGRLAGYDSGDETTRAALEDGYVYDTPPAAASDRTATSASGRYMLVTNPSLRYMNLLRRYDAPPDPTLETPPTRVHGNPSPSRHSAGHRQTVGTRTDWRTASHTPPARRGLSL